MENKNFVCKWLTIVVAICIGQSSYADNYKKETTLIPGIVFKSDQKIKDKNPSGKGVLTLTEKGGYVPWSVISIEGDFYGDTIYNGNAEDRFFLRFDANGTFSYGIEYDKQSKTTRLDVKLIDGLLNGCPAKDVPVITYIEDKNLHMSSIQVASSSFTTSMEGIDSDALTKLFANEQSKGQRFANSISTMQAFPNTSIKSITYSIAVENDGGFKRERNKIKLNLSPKYITTSDDVNIIVLVNPEAEFYKGDIQNPKAYCKSKYNYGDIEKMVVQTADGKSTITLQESKRKDSYSDALNKWTVKYNDGNVYSGTLNGTSNLAPLLSYKKPDYEAFLNMMVALSKIKSTEIPFYDGVMTSANGKTENYNNGISDTQLDATLNHEPTIIELEAPGTLLSAISPSELRKIYSLTIVGVMDQSDAKVLTELGANISYLNLKDCIILNTEDARGLKYCVIPSGFMKGSNALKEVILPRTATSIEDYGVFSNCPRLKKVEFPPYLESIGYAAFQNCPSLEEVNLPKSLRYIGDGGTEEYDCFSGSKNIKKVKFNGSSLSYNISLFGGANSLEEIWIPGYKTWSGGYNHIIGSTYQPIENAKVYVPSNVSSVYGNYVNCNFYFQAAKAPSKGSCSGLSCCIIHCPKGSTTSYYSEFGSDNEYIETAFPAMESEKDEYALKYINNQKQIERKLEETKARKADAEWRKKYGNNTEPCIQCFGTGIFNKKVGNTYYPQFCPYCNGSGVVRKK